MHVQTDGLENVKKIMLKNFVYLNLWFIHVFQKHKGRFLHADIPEIWQDYSEELRPWLLRLTEDFDLTFPLPKEPVNVVPCLLPGEQPEDVSHFIIFLHLGPGTRKFYETFTGQINRAIS